MSEFNVCDLSDCTEFRQTLLARPPAIIHGTAALLMLLIGAAIAWSAFSNANLVVIAAGRVRPIEQPARVFTSSASQVEARVAEVYFDEGDKVTQGQVLLRLDTQRLDNDIAKLGRQIETFRQEHAELARLDSLLADQFTSSKSKANAECQQATEEIGNTKRKRQSMIRQSEIDLDAAKEQLQRTRKLHQHHATSDASLVEAQTKVLQAEEKLNQSSLPVDEQRLAVLQQMLEVVNDDFAVRRAELEVKKVTNRGKKDAAEKDLANLMLARDQSTMLAPIDGIVVSKQIDVGDVLESGSPVIEIAKQDGFRFEAAVPSGDVGDLTLGMPVNIKFDAYDYQKYGTLDGTVCFISPDSKVGQGDKREMNPTVSPIAYVVRIELQGDAVGDDPLRGAVKLGLGGTAEIVTGRESILSIFLKKIRRTISLG